MSEPNNTGNIIAGIFLLLFGGCITLLGGGCTVMLLGSFTQADSVEGVLLLVSLAVLAVGLTLLWVAFKLFTGGFGR